MTNPTDHLDARWRNRLARAQSAAGSYRSGDWPTGRLILFVTYCFTRKRSLTAPAPASAPHRCGSWRSSPRPRAGARPPHGRRVHRLRDRGRSPCRFRRSRRGRVRCDGHRRQKVVIGSVDTSSCWIGPIADRPKPQRRQARLTFDHLRQVEVNDLATQ